MRETSGPDPFEAEQMHLGGSCLVEVPTTGAWTVITREWSSNVYPDSPRITPSTANCQSNGVRACHREELESTLAPHKALEPAS